jgi:hypothetical protein
MPGARLLGAFAIGLVTVDACAANPQRAPSAASPVAARPCVAADSTKGLRASALQLAGEFRLTMIATGGARTGRSATGLLTFDGRIGHASIALDSVGAIAAGDIGSRDPNRPGVLLVPAPNDSASAAGPMLRFGADANRTDIRAFDSAYLILLVDAITTAGFSGRWRSGVGTQLSSGHFCADRIA